MTDSASTFLRFPKYRRLEHIVLIASFTTLALTGLPQKYPTAGISQAFIAILGGIEAVRIIHRIAATLFLLESVYHLVVAGYLLYVKRERATMLPGIKDGVDAWQAFLYNLGLRKEAPKMGRYNFAEKAEYWAMIWGLLVMAVTGFMLWNPIATASVLPGQFIPAAKVAHGGEAVLAVLAIILWHFYNVHVKMWNSSIWNGQLTRHQMEEEHGLELEAIESGAAAPVRLSSADHRKRMNLFIPIAAVVSLVSLGAVYWFVTLEQTAIETVPPALENSGPAFQPMPATPAPDEAAASADGALNWTVVGPVFGAKCAACHGTAGGVALDSYSNAVQTPLILPGDAANSLVIQSQEAGGHPGMFSPEELEQIKQWIDAGAPEE